MGLGVILGAFGAHGLRDRLDAHSMSVYERAVFYHFINALGILIVSSLPKLTPSQRTWVCALLFAGVLIFSGSLYALAISGVRILGAITPIGGVSFIAAWFLLAWYLLHS
jgi:uncharacterized membrane protein YgdD (TMEM256/DUF423 family)